MTTLGQMEGMIKLPGDNPVDEMVAEMHQRLMRQHEALTQCGHLIKLLYGYNPDLPMGPGMKAQFQELMKEIENGR